MGISTSSRFSYLPGVALPHLSVPCFCAVKLTGLCRPNHASMVGVRLDIDIFSLRNRVNSQWQAEARRCRCVGVPGPEARLSGFIRSSASGSGLREANRNELHRDGRKAEGVTHRVGLR